MLSPPESGVEATPPPRHDRGERARSLATLLIMSLLVVAVYFPIAWLRDDNTLFALDYHQLHARRIRFAQEALFGGVGGPTALPAWYPRELMGTPFWSNVQNFPFIPSRLVLLAFDPLDAPVVGVNLAAVLAALFTYGFARRLGMTRVAAAAAGWTFACAGFFAARVMAGHLPLLEAYPALPLLLWRAEALLARRSAANVLALALATLCVVLAGHPQLPAYAIAVTGAYVLYRGHARGGAGGGGGWTAVRCAAASMALGAGCGAFALWPMFELVRRSTRVLDLAPAGNDLAFPYGRLLAWVFPWRDGWPGAELAAAGRFRGNYPGGVAVFWETVCYVGWLPLAAALFLLVRWAVLRGRARQRMPTPMAFFAIVGIVALLAALPAVQQATRHLPGTYLRSPARLVYVTTCSLALCTGFAVDVLARRRQRLSSDGPRWKRKLAGAGVAVLLVLHFADLGWHSRSFVRMTHVPNGRDATFVRLRAGLPAGARVGVDYTMPLRFNREVDDVGFFDSIMLARPYAALIDLAGLPPATNIQDLDASALPPRALAATGVHLVITFRRARDDLPLLDNGLLYRTYGVPDPLPRAAFLPASAAIAADPDETRRRLRDPQHDLGSHVLLPPRDWPETRRSIAHSPNGGGDDSDSGKVEYERPSSDEIVVQVAAPGDGILRVLESWDPGWRATLDGAATPVLCADGAFIAIPIPPGEHTVRLTYHTPGATAGIVISLASVALLIGLLAHERKRGRGTPGRANVD